mmetsp:Transcript_32913/g.95293  ORF Transcript_32913/g.95293 Transcript_32913/m.95293 type:complete len:220 (-) Transcript_32913:1432-2091(-)
MCICHAWRTHTTCWLVTGSFFGPRVDRLFQVPLATASLDLGDGGAHGVCAYCWTLSGGRTRRFEATLIRGNVRGHRCRRNVRWGMRRSVGRVRRRIMGWGLRRSAGGFAGGLGGGLGCGLGQRLAIQAYLRGGARAQTRWENDLTNLIVTNIKVEAPTRWRYRPRNYWSRPRNDWFLRECASTFIGELPQVEVKHRHGAMIAGRNTTNERARLHIIIAW